MSSSTFDIESIVREVMRRLTDRTNGGPAGPAADERSNTNTGTICLTDRIVTLAQIEGSLQGVNRLIVLPGAIVTPAVHDELRRNGVALQRDCEPADAVDEINSKWRILAGSHETGFDLGSLLAVKPEHRCDFELIKPGELTRLLQEIEGQLRVRRTLGLIVSSTPHVVACQANRSSAFRAAFVCDANEAAEARRTLDANLLAVRDTSVHRLLQIASSAVRTRCGK